jgi:hypothetical protein
MILILFNKTLLRIGTSCEIIRRVYHHIDLFDVLLIRLICSLIRVKKRSRENYFLLLLIYLRNVKIQIFFLLIGSEFRYERIDFVETRFLLGL